MAVNYQGFWRDKRVLVTGHTGFKGSWLCEWLLDLGASICGLSLPAPTQPSLFEQLALGKRLDHHIADIRDLELVQKLIVEWQPEILFHLAAQPLVRRSYIEPIETWSVNVMGTVHVLEALKALHSDCVGLFITTDKCYENREWLHGYRENDPLGGYDPYSSSKAGAELAIASWRNSFFQSSNVRIASARAGNVIGGGDWAEDRIVPDAMRALGRGDPIPVRNPQATRPWQHVLEPLSGYLLLAQSLYQADDLRRRKLCSAFNFGPALDSNRPVRDLVEAILSHWSGSWLDQSDPLAVHEANLLNLATDKAFHILDWQPRWNFEQTIKETVSWYREAESSGYDSSFLQQLTLQQIHRYQQS
jgi:CDP-glucose 4,6-dehydratase